MFRQIYCACAVQLIFFYDIWNPYPGQSDCDYDLYHSIRPFPCWLLKRCKHSCQTCRREVCIACLPIIKRFVNASIYLYMEMFYFFIFLPLLVIIFGYFLLLGIFNTGGFLLLVDACSISLCFWLLKTFVIIVYFLLNNFQGQTIFKLHRNS